MRVTAKDPQASGVDRQTVEAWTAHIAADQPDPIRAAFHARGARGPHIVWSPSADHLSPPQLSFLQSYWTALAGDRPMPCVTEIDPLAMRPALGYVTLMDVVDRGQDFRFRLFGSTVAAISGFDVTGRLLSQFRASAHIVQFFIAGYRAALQRQEPLFTDHGPAATLRTAGWQRLMLPLADAGGAVQRFLGGAVPIARDGRPITSVF